MLMSGKIKNTWKLLKRKKMKREKNEALPFCPFPLKGGRGKMAELRKETKLASFLTFPHSVHVTWLGEVPGIKLLWEPWCKGMIVYSVLRSNKKSCQNLSKGSRFVFFIADLKLIWQKCTPLPLLPPPPRLLRLRLLLRANWWVCTAYMVCRVLVGSNLCAGPVFCDFVFDIQTYMFWRQLPLSVPKVCEGFAFLMFFLFFYTCARRSPYRKTS